MCDRDDDLARHGLPPAPGGKKVLKLRWAARTGDWALLTEDGWWYCRAGDVEAPRREWRPSANEPGT